MNLILITIAVIEMLGLRAPARLVASIRDSYQPAHHISVLVLPPAPIEKPNVTDPGLGAAAVYAIDNTTGTVLYAKNADQPRPIASLTKMMTMLAILKEHSAGEVVTIPKLDAYQPDDSIAGFKPGEQFKLGDLVAAALIASDSDAADSLALYDSKTKEDFYGKMNAIAAAWGITDAHFTSSSGLDTPGNVASAHALATIARLGLHNDLFRKDVGTAQLTITSQAGGKYDLKTTDDLLSSGQTLGIKTGYTLAAGECFVGLAKVQGHEVVTVVLASPDRFAETTKLLAWINQTWSWSNN